MADLTEVVTELLEMASRHVSVNVLLLDRGFYSMKVFSRLKELVEIARQGRSKSKRIVLSGQVGESRVTLTVECSKKKKSGGDT